MSIIGKNMYISSKRTKQWINIPLRNTGRSKPISRESVCIYSIAKRKGEKMYVKHIALTDILVTVNILM